MHSLLESAEGSFGISSELKVLQSSSDSETCDFSYERHAWSSTDAAKMPSRFRRALLCSWFDHLRAEAAQCTLSSFFHLWLCVHTLSLTCSTRSRKSYGQHWRGQSQTQNIMYRRKHGQKEAFC